MKKLLNRIEYLKGRRDNLQTQISQKEKEWDEIGKTLNNVLEAQAILQRAAQDTQEKLEYYIGDMVNLALSSIFESVYNFNLTYESKRGQSEADMCLYKGDKRLNIMNDTGGGVVDIVAFALRVASWKIRQPFSTRSVIILDEPFRFLSAEYQIKAGEMLTSLSKNLGLQFIIVTHSENLMDTANKVFEVTINKKKSIINDLGRKKK